MALRSFRVSSRSLWFVDLTLLWAVPLLLLVFGVPLMHALQRGLPAYGVALVVMACSIFIVRVRVVEARTVAVTWYWLVFRRTRRYPADVVSVDFSDDNDTQDPDVVLFNRGAGSVETRDARRVAIQLRAMQNRSRSQ